MIDSDAYEAIVFGAGPAGACLAANLAPFHRVLVVERSALCDATPAPGETLAPAARRLFTDMGLWDAFCAEGHERWHANLSVWGDPGEAARPLVGDIDGHGWLLDRPRFDRWLRDVARRRGTALAVATRLLGAARESTGWRVGLDVDGRRRSLTSNILVDATGRRAALGRRIAARRTPEDRLVARWMRLEGESSEAGTTYVQADGEGWWYVAQTRSASTLAFFTDADLPAARRLADDPAFLEAAQHAGLTRRFGLATAVVRGSGTRAARSGTLDAVSGTDWLAVGDAAASFDPIGARGLFTALFCGLAAAEACDRRLAADADALADYGQVLQTILATYRQERHAIYAAETRWQDMPFWRRRHAVPAPATKVA